MPWSVNNKITIKVTGSVFGQPFNWSLDYRAETQPLFLDVVGLTTSFRDDIVIPGLAFQHANCYTAQVIATNRSQPMPSVVMNVNAPGSYVAIGALQPPPSLRFGLYKQVSSTFLWDDDSPELEYPIKRGYVFFPGITEDFMQNGGITIPGGIVGTFADWRGEFAAERTGGAVDFKPVVSGDDLYFPTDPPTIKRTEAYAYITDVIFRRMTHMSNSEGAQG